MKRTVLVLAILALAGTGVCAQQTGLRAGLQLGSDGFVSFLLYGSRAELGVKAKLSVVNIDYSDGDETTSSDNSLLVGGVHGGFLFGPGGDAVDLGVGVEFRLGIGLADLEYEPYVRLGPRLSANYLVHPKVLLSGILYPIWLSIEDMKKVGVSSVIGEIPHASVAISLLF
jgi:hypothetical protein